MTSIDGFECAGHPGEDGVGLAVRLPATADALPGTPKIASGGMADGRSIIVALPLGADALNMRTRFCATVEATIRQNVTQRIVGSSELDTVLVGRIEQTSVRIASRLASDLAWVRSRCHAHLGDTRLL